MKKILEKLIEYLFYFFVFVFIWQSKLIIFPAPTNYNEIAIYFNYLLLFLLIIVFIFYTIFYNKKEFLDKFDLDKYWVVLAGLEFFIFISILISPVREVSIFKYLLFLLAIGLLFVMTNFKFNIKKIFLVFLTAILIQAGLGIFQFFSQVPFSNKYLGLASHSASVLGTSVIESEAGRFVRAYGAVDHPNIFGALMFFGLVLLIFFIFKNDFQGYKKILTYISLFIILTALAVSFSRSAYLALAISLIVWFIIFLLDKNKIKKYYPLFIFIFLSIIIIFSFLRPLVLSRFDTSSRLEKISIDERGSQINFSSEIIKKNPWLGMGLGAYHYKILTEKPNLQPYEAQPVHNTFLLVWSEIGLWGLFFFIYFIFYIFKKNITNLDFSPIFIGFFVFMLFDHWLWSLPFGPLLFFFLISLTFYLKYDKV